MKILNAVLVLAALIPGIASADFVIGRVRTDAVAKMEVIQATGLYQGVKEVTMSTLVEDGKGLIGYQLTIDGQTMRFKLSQVGKDNGCGVKSEALGDSSLRSDILLLKDMSRAMCEIMVKHVWSVTLETRPPHTSAVSTLVIGGNPEYFANTL